MKKHICPICDKAMPTGHFCTNCKSWIKEPWTMDVNFYLNESHPQEESDCDYHDQKYFDRAMNQGRQGQEMARKPVFIQPKMAQSKSIQDIFNQVPEKQEEKEEPKKQVSGIMLVIIFIVFINVILPILTSVIRGLSDILEGIF